MWKGKDVYRTGPAPCLPGQHLPGELSPDRGHQPAQPTADLVDINPEIGADATEHIGLPLTHTVVLLQPQHQVLQRLLDCLLHRPVAVDGYQRLRSLQADVIQPLILDNVTAQGHLTGHLVSYAGNLTVPLRGVHIAEEEQPPFIKATI